MSWSVTFSSDAKDDLKRLDRHWAKKIVAYISHRIAALEDPTTQGKPLRANMVGFHRYRVGDYRVVCKINATEIEILVVSIGHRSVVYTS